MLSTRWTFPRKHKMPSIFTKIIAREIPADFVHEDELCVVIRDVHPKAPVHLLLIPKKEIPSLDDLNESDAPLLSHLFFVAQKVAEQEACKGSYKIQINVGKGGGQEIFHLHLHLLAWPNK